MWTLCKPCYSQVIVVLATIPQDDGSRLNLPCCYAFMSQRTEAEYDQVWSEIDQLIAKYSTNINFPNRKMDSRIIVTDSEKSLTNSLEKRVAKFGPGRFLNRCYFHLVANLKKKYSEELKNEISKLHKDFNPRIFEIYTVQKKLAYFPIHIILQLNRTLLDNLDNLAANHQYNTLLKSKLIKCINYVEKRFLNDEKLCWFPTIIQNYSKYLDLTNNQVERHNGLMKRHCLEYSGSRAIDGIRALKDLIIFKSIESLAENRNQYGFTRPSRPAVAHFDKMSDIPLSHFCKYPGPD